MGAASSRIVASGTPSGSSSTTLMNAPIPCRTAAQPAARPRFASGLSLGRPCAQKQQGRRKRSHAKPVPGICHVALFASGPVTTQVMHVVSATQLLPGLGSVLADEAYCLGKQGCINVPSLELVDVTPEGGGVFGYEDCHQERDQVSQSCRRQWRSDPSHSSQ